MSVNAYNDFTAIDRLSAPRRLGALLAAGIPFAVNPTPMPHGRHLWLRVNPEDEARVTALFAAQDATPAWDALTPDTPLPPGGWVVVTRWRPAPGLSALPVPPAHLLALPPVVVGPTEAATARAAAHVAWARHAALLGGPYTAFAPEFLANHLDATVYPVANPADRSGF